MNNMKKMMLVALIALIGWTAVGATAQPELSDEELLQTMDFMRFGGYFAGEAPSTTFTVEIIADRPDGTQQAVVQVSFNANAGIFRIDYLTPEELTGDVFIVTNEEVFFWNPDLISPIQVNGSFEVFGDATVAEVVGIFFQGDYNITGRDFSNLDGVDTLVLDLEATRESVAFPIARVVADAQTLQPITLELFDASGDLLHLNTFEAYSEVDGLPYFETQLLDNRIVPVNRTLMTITNIENTDLAESLFDPNELGN